MHRISKLEENQIVMIVGTTSHCLGFVNKLFKVLAVDEDYAVLLWLESHLQSRHRVAMPEFEFAEPCREFIDTRLPDDDWAEIVYE